MNEDYARKHDKYIFVEFIISVLPYGLKGNILTHFNKILKDVKILFLN